MHSSARDGISLTFKRWPPRQIAQDCQCHERSMHEATCFCWVEAYTDLSAAVQCTTSGSALIAIDIELLGCQQHSALLSQPLT
eukprot:6394373-Amphidinium_carterae.2